MRKTKLLRSKKDAITIAVFLIIVAGFFYKTLLLGKHPVPSDALVGMYHPWRDLYAKEYPRGIPFKNPLITDPIRQQIPWRKLVIDSWKEGRIPKYNPLSFAGTPLDANIQAAAFYPLNIIFLFLNFKIAWTLLIILQPLLAGLFMYAYLRHLNLMGIAAFIGSLAWSFSGFLTAWLTWGTIGHVALWLPLILLAIDKVISHDWQKSIVLHSTKVKWIVILTAVLVMSFFAGHSQVFFYVALLGFVYALWRVQQLDDARRRVIRRWLPTSLVVIAAITAIQWVPLVRFLSQTSRLEDITVWQKSGWFIPWQHLVQFFAPDFFGNPSTGNYWGEWNYGEFVGYIGVLPLILALVALLVSKRLEAGFFRWALIVSLLFAFPTPIAKLPYALKFPILSSLQPTRLLIIVDFSLAVLAAIGLEALMEKKKDWRLPVVLSGFVFGALWVIVFLGTQVANVEVVGNWLITKRNLLLPTALFIASEVWLFGQGFFRVSILRYLVYGVMVGLVAFDLLRFGWKFTPFTPTEYFFPETAVIKFLKEQPKPFRVASLDPRILPPNVAAYFGIETIEGYDPLYSQRLEEFLVASERGKPDLARPFGFNRILAVTNIDSALFSYFNARYVLSLTDLDKPFLRQVFVEGETRVYEYLSALPRVYLAERVKIMGRKSKEETLTELFRESIKNENLAFTEVPVSAASLPLHSEETVEITSYLSGEMTFSVRTLNPRFLVVLNPFDTRWQATIDGKRVNILRVNYLFQGIELSSGFHQVRLFYR